MSVNYDVSLVKTRYLWPQKKCICTILTLINQVPGLPCVSQGTVIYLFHFGVCVSLLFCVSYYLFAGCVRHSPCSLRSVVGIVATRLQAANRVGRSLIYKIKQ